MFCFEPLKFEDCLQQRLGTKHRGEELNETANPNCGDSSCSYPHPTPHLSAQLPENWHPNMLDIKMEDSLLKNLSSPK